MDAALEVLPADLWRWWLVSNARESSDTDFDFHRFAADVNADLADSFGNLANRLLSFVVTRFGEQVPLGGESGPMEFQPVEISSFCRQPCRRLFTSDADRQAEARSQTLRWNFRLRLPC